MERAPVFRTTGPLRIAYGLDIADLTVGLCTFPLAMHLLPFDGLGALLLSAVAGGAVAKVSSGNKYRLPVGGMRQFARWLGQGRVYRPGPDPDARPLVYHEEP